MLNVTINFQANEDRYLTIANEVRRSIQSGRIKRNEILPSSRRLAEQIGCNRHTVMSAYQELIAEGWVESVERKRYRVASSLPETHCQNIRNDPSIKEKFRWETSFDLRISNTDIEPQYKFNFAGGLPDYEQFPFKKFRHYLSNALQSKDEIELSYQNTAGVTAFLEQASEYLRRARSITNKKIIVVNGTQEALYLTARCLLRPNDLVLVEELGYQAAWQTFQLAGAKLKAVKLDQYGLDPSHLEDVIVSAKEQGQTIRALYLTPLHQYPTTKTMPASRRLAIYELACRYQVPIIEDDYDHEFHYRCQPLAPFASFDHQGLVIYMATFSKICFPGARVGLIAVEPELAEIILKYREMMNRKPNIITQVALAQWMKDGEFERHLNRVTKEYERRRNYMAERLVQYQNNGVDIHFSLPDGGMAFWIDIGCPSKKITLQLKALGVFCHSESDFAMEKSTNQGQHLRLGFAHQNEEKTNEGLNIIMKLVRKAQQHSGNNH